MRCVALSFMNRVKSQKGFLLLELLLAVATGLVVLTVMFHALSMTLRLQEAGESRSNMSQNAQVALQRMEQQLLLNARTISFHSEYLHTVDVSGNREVGFSRSVNTEGVGVLYIVVKNGMELPGVNQLTDPSNVDVRYFNVSVVDGFLKIEVGLRDLRTGRQAEYSAYVRPSNGRII